MHMNTVIVSDLLPSKTFCGNFYFMMSGIPTSQTKLRKISLGEAITIAYVERSGSSFSRKCGSWSSSSSKLWESTITNLNDCPSRPPLGASTALLALFEPLKLLNFDFNANQDPTFHSNAHPDPASKITADPCRPDHQSRFLTHSDTNLAQNPCFEHGSIITQLSWIRI